MVLNTLLLAFRLFPSFLRSCLCPLSSLLFFCFLSGAKVISRSPTTVVVFALEEGLRSLSFDTLLPNVESRFGPALRVLEEETTIWGPR